MNTKRKGATTSATPMNQINSTTKTRLLSILTDKPTEKEYLAKRLNCSEREIRRTVQELRNEGHVICSSAHSKGYWIGNDSDKKQLIKEYRSRAMQMLNTANVLEGQIEGQVEMNVLV